jgi:hypothetical protein
MQRMRIFLQQRETGLYLKDVDIWTSDRSEAMEFVSSTTALEFCQINKLDAVQVVLRFEEEHYEIVLPDVISQVPRHDRPRGTV